MRKRELVKAAVDFKLGYVRDPLPGDEQFTGRLAIPYLTPSGTVAMKYRCIADHNCKEQSHPKYTQPSGQQQHLYNVAAYHSGLNVIGIIEGEIDAISATVHVGLPTMGVPGATQWEANRQWWRIALDDFDLIVIFADGDEPGYKAAKAVEADAKGRSRLVRLPDGEDVNSMVVAGRVDELKRKAGLF